MYFCSVRKILLSILTFIYLGVSSGLAMEVHYCMGKKAGVDFFASSDDRCNRCGMKEKNTGCCHDEHSFYKLTVDQKHVVNDISFEQAPVILLTAYYIHSWMIQGQTVHPFTPDHSPPLSIPGIQTCILHGVFRL